MKTSTTVLFSVLALILSVSSVSSEEISSIAPPLSPEESIKTMKIQPGYKVVPVLTEPVIHEPSAVTWDGNGRMYVVEMRTYMQDIDGKNQLAPTSRVSRHEDTNGDGVYDKHTVFADNLSLPRMVLPLIDKVIIRETNTLDLKSYQDTNGDGVADKIEVWHEGGSRGGNLEHQPSGLIWNIDNWLYTTYSRHRYRFTNGEVIQEPLPHGSGQWGLTHDDVGRIFYSSAGGENPAMDFQRPIVYGQLSLSGEQAEGFREVFPIETVPDKQGGKGRLNPSNGLNRFTASCGQSIFRGDRMPHDLRGDLIICEPVGRLVRRAKVTNDQGRIIVSNAYDQEEFIAATDPNFRPVNSATGPDGALYLVDMYRGIIQEGNWVREGSYLREIVKKYELQKNIGRGRIFRVEHETTQRGEQPRMLDETPAQLVQHLTHPNGWWRSEAQKLIILHGDKSVVPALKKLAISSENPLARLHALWTLEGLAAIDESLLIQACADQDEQVRSAAIRISEGFFAEATALSQTVADMANDKSPEVAIQLALSVNHAGHPQAEEITNQVLELNKTNDSVKGIVDRVRSNMAAIIAERKKLEELRRRNKVLADSIVRGKRIYNSICITCHGQDGKGVPSPDKKGMMQAPPLAGSKRVQGHKERLTRILLHGLVGPVEDKTYAAGLMLPMGANNDQWIADVTTYIRNSWNNRAPLIEASDIQRIRSETSNRLGPWTLKELKAYDLPTLESRKNWKLSASHGSDKLISAIDGNQKSRWDTGATQKPGMWFSIELPEPTKVLSLTLDTRGSNDDYPRGYLVHVSNDGKSWGEPVAQGTGSHPITELELNTQGSLKFIRITQTGSSPNKYWSIHELSIKGQPLSEIKPAGPSLAELLSKEDPVELAKAALTKGDATRGAALFFNPGITCVKCHEPSTGERLGPDLSAKRDGVSNPFLVESVLHPSKVIRKGFEPLSIQTEEGLVVTGFKVKETDDVLVLKEPASGKEIEIPQEEIAGLKLGKVSAMPPGLVNLLKDRQQFLDLARFLIEVNRGGPARMKEFKSQVAQ